MTRASGFWKPHHTFGALRQALECHGRSSPKQRVALTDGSTPRYEFMRLGVMCNAPPPFYPPRRMPLHGPQPASLLSPVSAGGVTGQRVGGGVYTGCAALGPRRSSLLLAQRRRL